MNALLPSMLFLLAQAPAPLACATPIADCGEVRTGPSLAHTFDFKNEGSATVEIDTVEFGCGCGRSKLSTKTVPPGGTTKLEVQINTLALGEGPASWSATVQYRAGEVRHAASVHLKATVRREVSLDPPVIAVSTTGATSQTITFTDRRAVPTKIAKCTSSTPGFAVDIAAPTDTAGVRTQIMTWKTPADLPVGNHEGTLVFSTDDPAYPELRVSLKVFKRAPGAIECFPPLAMVSIPAGGMQGSLRVQLRAGEKPLAIAKATSDKDGVEAKFSEGIAATAVVKVVVDSAKAGANGTATVTVEMAEPKGEKVSIPVKW